MTSETSSLYGSSSKNIRKISRDWVGFFNIFTFHGDFPRSWGASRNINLPKKTNPLKIYIYIFYGSPVSVIFCDNFPHQRSPNSSSGLAGLHMRLKTMEFDLAGLLGLLPELGGQTIGAGRAGMYRLCV